MSRIGLTLLALLVFVGVGKVSAQTATAAATATITIPTLISIDVTNVDDVTFPQPDLSDYDVGHVGMTSGTSVISTRANIVHRVTVASDAGFFTGGDGSKPAEHLQWGTAGVSGAFSDLTTAAADVVTDLSRGTHPTAAEVWYRLVLDETTDEPGTYELAFTYTALAN